MTAPPPPVLVVDTTDPTPPYEQLRRQLADLIGTGRLAGGTKLPPVRQLAVDLGLAPGTVARAYAELDAAGLVVSRRGGGTRVLAPDVTLPVPGDDLERLAREFVVQARAGGHRAEAILAALRRSLDG